METVVPEAETEFIVGDQELSHGHPSSARQHHVAWSLKTQAAL